MAVGEIKVGDLPTLEREDFKANDFIFIIHEGQIASKLSRVDLLTTIEALVKGEKGDRGAVGNTGERGDRGEKGLKGDRGIQGIKGATGDAGLNGINGWSPVLAVISDGVRRVHQVVDWVGGQGVKPTTGLYIGSLGLVPLISDARDVRGTQGEKGDIGEKGDRGIQGVKGVDGKSIASITHEANNSIKVTFTDNTTISTDSTISQLGWASYKDTQYTASNKLSIPANSVVVLPNNASVVIDNNQPIDETLYDSSIQKIQMQSTNSLYGVRVRFKLINLGTSQSFVTVLFDKSTTDVPFNEDKITRPDSSVQVIDVCTQIYSDQTILSNGLTVRFKTEATNVQVYDVEFIVSKLT